ncbi:hypothetical protein KKG48_00845 [Patescibacteria group bacterium]|nr:hypothetical protein [Patescibacteria group bacterium]MCG2695038.1 hypothetical protein [Candidatus Parcubacteria bacterium]
MSKQIRIIGRGKGAEIRIGTIFQIKPFFCGLYFLVSAEKTLQECEPSKERERALWLVQQLTESKKRESFLAPVSNFF